MNFAYKMDDKDEVLGLVNRMMTAIRRPGSEYTRSLMNETQAQMDNFPDGMNRFYRNARSRNPTGTHVSS